MECQLKWKVTQNEMGLKTEYHKKKCHSKWNFTQNRMSLEMEFHSKWNVTQTGL